MWNILSENSKSVQQDAYYKPIHVKKKINVYIYAYKDICKGDSQDT